MNSQFLCKSHSSLLTLLNALAYLSAAPTRCYQTLLSLSFSKKLAVVITIFPTNHQAVVIHRAIRIGKLRGLRQ